MKITIKKKIKKDEKLLEDEIIDFLLKNRGIDDKENFLNPKHPEKISFGNFFSQDDFIKVIKKLREIKEKNEMIVVYTDYDADGITGGAILWETLHLLGFKVMPYVPHRQLEGYGFSKKGIDKVKELYCPSLIISVDHGITAAEQISYAKSLGIPIIVTDHHLKSEKKPKDALAIFHTERLSGAGVAYFFAKEIFTTFQPMAETRSITRLIASLQNNFSYDYLALASIGAIADLVPLIDYSRSLVKNGLSIFSKVRRAGIRQILKEAGIENRKITPYEIGFIIAPRINALGRLEHAIDALRLLCTKKEDRAQMLAAKMGEKNRERQNLLEEAVEEAREKLKVQSLGFKILPKIIVLFSDNWHEGIIGLIAAKIAEEFYRPTIILTKSDSYYKASARSIPGFHITNFLRSFSHYLVDVGGHKQAAGFTIEAKNLNNLCAAVVKNVSQFLNEEDLERKIEVDLAIPLSKINLSLVKKIENLEPFGIANPQPLFYSEGKLIEAKLFGKNNEHLKIYLKDGSSLPLELVFFGEGEQFFKLSRGQKLGVVYTLEIDRWNKEEKVRGKGKLVRVI